MVNLHNTKIIHRNLLHSYTLTTKDGKKKLRKQFHLPLQQKRIKYLGVNITKETEDPYTENYKIVMKEIKNNKNRWKYTLHSWIGRINIMKVTVYSKKCIYSKHSLPY